MRYEIDPRGFVRITASESPTLKEELALYQKMMADPAFHPGINILLDNRMRSTTSETSHIKKMSHLVSKSSSELQGCCCAIVVASDAEFGMARMYGLVSGDDPMSTAVFRELEEAEAWLISKAD